MKKSLFPHDVENQLRRVFKFHSKKLLSKYKEAMQEEELMELPNIEFSNLEKKKIIEDLTKVAIATNKHVFESWRTLTDEELKRPDLTGAKYWIRENYFRVNGLSKTFPTQMENFKEKQYKEILKSFNAPLDHRFSRMIDGKISQTDINKLLTELKGYYAPSNDIKHLIEKLERNRTLGQAEMSKLHDWANRRNELWARNEAGNIYASQLEDLWLENGIEYYIWHTMQDDRVRMEHVEKDGKIFRIDEDVLPGQEFGCRCWAESVKNKGGNNGN